MVGDCSVGLHQNIIKNCFDVVSFFFLLVVFGLNMRQVPLHQISELHEFLQLSRIDLIPRHRVTQCKMAAKTYGGELAKKDNKHEEGEIHNIVSLSEYIDAILYDILSEANTAVSYNPCIA